jgi:hypothetical protein
MDNTHKKTPIARTTHPKDPLVMDIEQQPQKDPIARTKHPKRPPSMVMGRGH